MLPVDHTAGCFTLRTDWGEVKPFVFLAEAFGNPEARGGPNATVASGLQAPFWMHQERNKPTFLGHCAYNLGGKWESHKNIILKF